MNSKHLIKNSDHYRGSVEAPVLLVEYGDFECPHCAAAFPELERLVKASPRELCFVFRYFPLTMGHPHAQMAALAAEAAGRQNQFWPMHHLLFTNFDQLSEDSIAAMAKSLKLDMRQFQSDLSNDELLTRVRGDFASGVRHGVNGTPTLFFNGNRYDGPRTYSALKMVVDSLASGNDVMAPI